MPGTTIFAVAEQFRFPVELAFVAEMPLQTFEFGLQCLAFHPLDQ